MGDRTAPAGFRPRPISDLGNVEVAGWTFKTYGISYAAERPRPELVDAARALVDWLVILPASGVREAGHVTYGVGFVGVHDGRDGCLVFVDWWADGNELHHHVFTAPVDDPTALEDRTGSGLAACVTDLEVIDFERRAWIDAIRDDEGDPDVAGYLARRLEVPLPPPGGTVPL